MDYKSKHIHEMSVSFLSSALFKPISNASLVLLRIISGLFFFVEIFRYFYADWINSYWMQPTYLFKYQGFEWVQPLPGDGLYYLFGVLALAALGISFGFLYRISSIVFFLGFSYSFLLDKSLYLNHFYMDILLAFLLCFVPANRRFALDCYIFKNQTNIMSSWCLKVFQWQVGLVYFFGGIAKINHDWLAGEPMRLYLTARIQNPNILKYVSHDTMAWITSYGGLFIDLFALPALLYKKTRIPACIVLISFHAINQRLFHIGLFPFIMVALLLIFFPAHLFERIIPRVHERIQSNYAFSKRAIICFLSVYMAIQIIMPLRHYLYDGPVIWNEEGLRFAWHMKLRGKTGLAKFTIAYKDGTTEIIDPSEELLSYQHLHMSYQPDMILSYAHHIRDKKIKEGRENFKIYVDASCALNGREKQRFIDPKTDLAKEDFSYKAYPWIAPLTTALNPKNSKL